MTRTSRTRRAHLRRYRRARIRNYLFTVGPNRLTGGKINRRHLAQDFSVREVEVTSPSWPAAYDGLRIGHVSDFHLGELLPLERALDVIESLREQEPDLIFTTRKRAPFWTRSARLIRRSAPSSCSVTTTSWMMPTS